MISLVKKRLNKNSGKLWKIAISLVGIFLILIAVCHLLLFFLGESTTAQVSTRRYGGSTDREPDQRYSWAIDYTFKDDEGNLYSGHTTKYGNDMNVNAGNKVYYFTVLPFINALEYEVSPNIGQLFVIALGIFMIYIMNKKEAKR